MPFCPSCGTSADGKFCPKCGTAIGAAPGYVPPPPPPPPGYQQGYPPPPINVPGLTSNVAAALTYIPVVIPIIFLVIEPYKSDRSVRFHAYQSLLLFAAYVAASIVVGIVVGISFHLYFLHNVVHLAWLAVSILAALKAFQGEKFILPVIGPIADKQA